MKTNSRAMYGAFAAAAFLAGAVSSVSGQIITLFGTVTDVTGEYAEAFSPGAPTWLAIDMAPPLDDAVPDIPEIGIFFNRPIAFIVGGEAFPMTDWTGGVVIYNKVGGWMSGLAGDFQGPDSEESAALGFALLGETNLITSDTVFPGGIPIGSFTTREGSYTDDEGSISWIIDAYQSGMGTVAVPEPATYGLLGAVLLVASIYVRRLRKARRD